MKTRITLTSILAIFVACAFSAPGSVRAQELTDNTKSDAAAKVSYYKDIRPIFQAHCQGCHQPAKKSGEYVMTSFEHLLKGGQSESAAIEPGKPDESYLVELITPSDGEADMPKGQRPLANTQIELIRKWIEQGATDDTPANARVRYDVDHPPLYSAPPVITSIDFSPDGSILAVAGFHEVLLHKADGSGLAGRLVGMSERIESVRFSPDGKRLAVAGGQPGRMGEIQVWDLEKKQLTLSHPITFDTVYGASWSPDGKLISFGCGDTTLRVIEADTGQQVLFQGSHDDWVLDTVFSTKGDHVMSVGRDGTAKLTELDTQRFIDNITSITPGALKGGIGSVDRHPTEDAIVVGGADGVPKIYRVIRESKRVIGDDANLIKKMPGLPGRVFSVAFSADGKRVAAGSSLNGSGELAIYEVDFQVKLPDELKKIVEKVASTRKPEEHKKLEQSRTEGVELVGKSTIDGSGIYAVAFSPNGKMVAAGGADGSVRLYSSDSASLVKEFVPVPIATAEKLAASGEGISGDDAIASDDTAADSAESSVAADLPEGIKLVGIDVQPSSIKLDNRFDSVQLIVTSRLESGDVIDVTHLAKRDLSADVVQISKGGLIRPKLNGQARLTVSAGQQSTVVPIEVSGVVSQPPVSFIRDVAPALSKLGCNAGTCHGSKEGKNGFKLSLRGYDALFDVRALTDDHASRRVNTASPDDSLMLLKATGAVPHVGAQRTLPGEAYYEIIRRWIADGAKLDLDVPRVASIEITPQNPIVQQIGGRQQMRIIATYSDGARRDVTAETFVESGNTDIVKVDASGRVETLRRGEAPVLARYEGKYTATTITVMGDRSGFNWDDQPANNYIDELVANKWQRMKIRPSGLCGDAEFIRRVHLDLTGLPPTREDVRKFLDDSRDSNAKRNELIDRLVGSEDFVDHWTNKWADLLQVNRKFLGQEGAKAFREWIRNNVKDNTPYDQFVYKILTASGSNRENPAASYYKILRTPEETMENTTHLFLATRFNCNKCHDHPFERWTQDQYYETAAFFSQVGLKKDPESKDKRIGGTAVEGAKPLYEIVFDKNKGDVTHERTGKVTAPVFPYLASHTSQEDASRRERLARWITSKDNQYFARSYVNRLWGYLLGVGLIEPLDDIRAGNPPTNPELLQALTTQFLDSNFDVQDLIRTICKSRTYQLSIDTNQWNQDDVINYSHAVARRLPAEVLFDAIHRVTGSVAKIPGVPEGTRAAALPDVGVKLPDGFLQNFGRPPRESACECERSTGMQLGPVMALVSGPTLSKAISDPENEVAKLASSDLDDERLVEELFIRILNRPPSADEVAAGVETIRAIPTEHDQLLAELKAYEKELEPITAKKEKEREERIAAAKVELAAYEKELAPKLAKMELEKQQKTMQLTAELKAYESTLPAQLIKWEYEKLAEETVWVPLDPHELSSTFGAKLTKEKDLSVFASEKNGSGSYKFVAETNLVGITAIRLELLADKRLPKNGPGRNKDDGNFALTELEVSASPASDPEKSTKLKLENAKADFSQANFEVAKAIDGDLGNLNGWASSPKLGVNRTATFELKEPIGDGDAAVLTFELKQLLATKKHSIGRFRVSVTTSPRPVELDGIPPNVSNILLIARNKRNEKQKEKLLAFFRTFDEELNSRIAAVEESKKPLPIDPHLKSLKDHLEFVSLPVPKDSKLARLERAVELSEEQVKNPRLVGAQDVAWALINSPAFLFNR